MSSRPYAQIECSLTGSKKLRKLSNGETRWAYICAHLSDFATYSGLFHYPKHMWAHDAQLTMDELDDAIAELVDADLIEFDDDEEIIRIVGWFHKRSGPDNPNRVKSVIADLSGLQDLPSVMFQRAAAELAIASIRRSLSWKSDSRGRDQLYADIQAFLGELFTEFGDTFLGFLQVEMATSTGTVRSQLQAIFPPLLMNPGPPTANPSERVTPTVAEHETRRDVDDTKTKQDENENETVQKSEIADPTLSAPLNSEVAVLRIDSSKPKSAAPIKPLKETKLSALAMGGR